MLFIYFVNDVGAIVQAVASGTPQPELPGLTQVSCDRWIPLDRAEYRDGQIVEREA